MILLDSMPVQRVCGGLVEMFKVEEDKRMPYRLRLTLPDGKQYAVAMMREDTTRAVMKNWAKGQTNVPWAHLVDGETYMD